MTVRIPNWQMATTHRRLLLCFLLAMALMIPKNSNAQIEDSLAMEVDTLHVAVDQAAMESLIVDNEDTTDAMPNDTALLSLLETVLAGHDIPYDYWQCDKINPYRDIDLPMPFNIKFNQTHFAHPVDDTIVITSRFGRRRSGPHRGLDIDLVTGDSVRSVLAGRVRFVGYSRGHGKTIVVRHANEIETVYAHLSDYAVGPNELIKQGQTLGFGGNTGNSRGSHLHLEVRYKGIAIHPEYVFNFDGSQSIRGKELWVTNEWKSPRLHSSYRQSELRPLFTQSEALVAQSREPKYYQVQKGDTLWRIALSHNLGLRQICTLNAISKSSVLRIGQMIQVR